MPNKEKDNTDQVCLLISKRGRVKFHTASDKKEKVKAGALLHIDGAIKLPPNAYVLLFFNGHYIRLDQPGKHELKSVLPEGKLQKLNFDTRFNRYLMAAIDLVIYAEEGDAWHQLAHAKGSGDGWAAQARGLGERKPGPDGWGAQARGVGKPKPGPDGWGAQARGVGGPKPGPDGWGAQARGVGKPKPGPDGWGDEDGRITPILPFGKLPIESVIFQWSQPQGSHSYRLEILTEQDEVIFNTKVKDNWAMVNLKSLTLEKEVTYSWRLVDSDEPDKGSAKIQIMLTAPLSDASFKEKLKKSDAYQLDDAVLNGLMEAVVLEEAEHFYEAHQRYEMLRQSFKKNNLVKLMQAAFYVRYNLQPIAQQLFAERQD